MKYSDSFQEQVVIPILEGYVKGSYEKLRELYSARLDEINKRLEDNYCKEEMIKYRKSIISGFKKIGMWKDDNI